MFHSLTKLARLSTVTRLAAQPAAAPINYSRSFTSSSILYAKKGKKENKKDKKGNKNDKNLDAEPEIVLEPKKILSDLKVKFDTSFDEFNKKLTAIKMGKSNPDIFDNLKIKIDSSYTANFKEVATVSSKGNFLNVVVFDPNHTKRIISSILEANLNLNPEQDPNNEQLLKIKLPNSTKEVKTQQIKEMKELLDQYKSNNGFKSSLQAIRSVFMKDLKNVDGSKDIVKKISTDIDSTFKSYSEKMTDAFKKNEKTLL